MADQNRKLPKLPDSLAAWLDSSLRPLHDFYLWCQTVDTRLRSLLNGLDGALEDIENIGSMQIVDDWTDFIVEVENDTITVQIEAPFSGTITSTITDCDSGTCTFRAQINGVNVGTQTNSVSTTKQTRTHTTANTFAVGDLIEYVISGNSSCLGMRAQINYTRPLVDG